MFVDVNIFLCLISVFLSIKHNSDASVDNIITLKPIISDVLSKSDSTSCNRPCKLGVKPKRCVFKFKVSQLILDEDGSVGLGINDQQPGPALNVCLHDVVVVEVTNNIPNQELSMHWHGLDQRGSPWMDGVPMITQCPITYTTTYKYAFKANAVGTHFYHAFSVTQQADGVYGALIVSQPTILEPHSKHYDYDRNEEHSLLIGARHGTLLSGNFDDSARQKPIGLRVNGRQDYKIYVNPGYKYRMRLVNAIAVECPVRVSLQEHSFAVIASDGKPVKMNETESVELNSGERLDAIITASRPVTGYWLVVKGLENCQNLSTSVLVVYEGFNFTSNSLPHFNDIITPKQAPLQGLKLRSLTELPASFKLEPALKVHLSLDRSKVEPRDTDYRYLSDALPAAPFYPAQLSTKQDLVRINGKNFMYPNSPLLTQEKDVKPRVFCQAGDENSNPDAQCLLNIQTELNQLVEIALVNEGTIGNDSYTIHFHGNPVYVVADGHKSRLAGGLETTVVERNLNDPPLKDTITIRKAHFVLVRLVTDNPGEWLIECRSCSTGSLPVAVVLRIPHAIPRAVTDALPKCGNYRPPDILLN